MYKDIIFECHTPEDVIKCEKIGERYGWNWEKSALYASRKYADINNIGYITFSIDYTEDPSPKVMFWENKSYSKEKVINLYKDDNNGDYEYTDNLITLRLYLSGGIVIDYNEPKKLVYENLTYEKDDIIIFIVNDKTDFLNGQKIGFKYGYKWSYRPDDGIKTYDNHTKCLVFSGKYKSISGSVYNIKDVIESHHSDYFNVKTAHSIDELLRVINNGKVVDYNEPKKLVYENKIYTFNEYKNNSL